MSRATESVRRSAVETAVVTGAASGIGARQVVRLRAAGVRVVAADRDLAVETRFAGDPGVVPLAGDVREPAHAAQLVATAEQAFGPVELLFHCAGIMPGGRIADSPAERFHDVMDVNYGGMVNVTKAVLPGMRERGAGRIVVLGSLTGYLPTHGFAAYSASKAAVNTYVETLAAEERPNGIRVLLAAPNAVKTPLLAQATGAAKLITDLADRESSPLMLSVDRVLDDIDRALERGRTVVVPGGRALYAMRRFSPSLTWALETRITQGRRGR
ncbi:SDR family NAD(P)-dependent oxidoreductase [Agromyces seonyuensis]|uniref:SDR family NAD(P)-dependent oxidoreductase n=1 Tax=Agromyces seonyuensis TaxID=2662446 RepID=A0A6I4P1L0_9MICO|nr:SDR family oxidoreductase [Agromyces seonyuensis]MWB97004.1 SDR family NAD(P)-dependent oxidoreductase [Agromyces seonyuensis]